MTNNTSRLHIVSRCSSRRNLLRASIAGGLALATNVPIFLSRLCAATSKENDRILVVFQFSGGNDGLSTIVPHDCSSASFTTVAPRIL